MNMMARLARLTLAVGVVVLSTLLTACSAYKVQAPYDAFVCFDSTFNHCYGTAQSGQLKTLYTTSFARLAATPGGSVVPPILIDPDALKEFASKDTKYHCQFGAIPYTQTLQPDQQAPAVFVSPVLLRQIGEQQLKLARIRTSCQRLLQAYDYQIDILVLQDKLSVAQKATALLSSEVEQARLLKDGFGSRSLTQSEGTQYGVNPGPLRDELRAIRDNAVAIGEQLRNMYKTQIVDVDYKKQFDDENLAIELQLRELGRSLFILDRSTVQYQQHRLLPSGYVTGSWVKQGTIVLSSHGWRHQ